MGTCVEDSAATREERRGRLLIIDDEPLVASAIRRGLLREHEVVTATSGADGLSRIRSGEMFDLILCDLTMPGVDGVQIYLEVARFSPATLERIVFLTGGAFTHRTRAFLGALPLDRVIYKPFEVAEIRERIRGRLPA